MLNSYQFSERYNVQSVIFGVAHLVYHAGCAGRNVVGYVWGKRRVVGAAIAIPLALVAAMAFILLSVATYLAGKVGIWVWDRRAQIGYGALVAAKALALTGLCVAGFVAVSMIPLAFWAGVAVSAVVSYVGYGAAVR
jgi:hypothetical protein